MNRNLNEAVGCKAPVLVFFALPPNPASPSPTRSAAWLSFSLHAYLTACICQEVLESQLPHKIVNLIFNW